MWKQVLQVASRFWKVAEETERNSKEIRDLRSELEATGNMVERLMFEVQRLRENDAHERDKLALRLENELLRFERRLPAPKGK